MSTLFRRIEREPDVMAIGLVRKSTKDDGKQVASLERQRAEIQRVEPGVQKWWSEKGSGTLADRDSIEELLAWCKQNSRPKSKPGKLFVWEFSRFSRPVYREAGKLIPDALAGLRLMGEFAEYGWKVVDVTLGEQDGIAHILNAVLALDKSGAESSKISERVRSGKGNKFDNGWHQGVPPWPCVRINTITGKAIPFGEQGAEVPTMLAGRPKRVRLWINLAKRFLRGATYASLAEWLNEKKVPSGRGKVGHWNKTSVANLLTNVKLIGYQEKRTEGSYTAATFTRLAQPIRKKANWEPIVPPKLFNAVQKEAQRRKDSDQRTRNDKSAFLLRPTCSRCGVPLSTCTVRGHRYYRHAGIKQPGNSPTKKAIMAAGCTASYYVPAEPLENEVYTRIIQSRSSEEYATYLHGLIESRIGVVSSARVTLKRLEKEQEELDTAFLNTVRAHIAAQGRGLPEKPYLDEMERLNRRLQELAVELPEAQAEAAADVNVWDSVREMMEELSAVAVQWDTASNEQKRHIFAAWVKSLAVGVESDEFNRSSKRVAVLELRLTPDKAVIDLDDCSGKDASPCTRGS